MSYTYDYPRPSVSADAVVFRKSDNKIELLLIRRANAPFKGMWALPGGFMDMDETPDNAAARELKEETGLDGLALHQFYAYGAVDRDPRHRTISIAYAGMLTQKNARIKAADDAAETRWFNVDELPETGFDHAIIIQGAKAFASKMNWF